MKQMQNIHRQGGWFFLPWIGAAFTALSSLGTMIFTAVGLWLAKYAAKIAITSVLLSVYVTTFVGAYLGITACLAMMLASSPPMPNAIATASSWVLPGNINQFIACVTTIFLFEVAFKHKSKLADIIQRGAS
jgi:hypothetical protein